MFPWGCFLASMYYHQLLLGSTQTKASNTTSYHLAESKPAQPHRSQYQPGNLIGRGPSFQLLQATCLGQSQEDPCEDTSSLLFMCLQNSCSCCRKCLAPTQQAQGEVDVPAFPVHCQRKDTLNGRSIPLWVPCIHRPEDWGQTHGDGQ